MRIPAFEVIPRGYGIAYRLYNQDAIIVYPVPVNWIVRWYRMSVAYLRKPPLTLEDKKLREQYLRGYLDGQAVITKTLDQSIREAMHKDAGGDR